MRTAGILLSLIGALALVGCGDDTDPPVIKLDTGGGQQDTGGGQQDTGGGQQDTGGGQQDTGTSTGSNSGAICSQTVACPDPTEGCFPLSGGTKGMCLGACNAQGADCKVADATNQLSKCYIQEKTTSKLYCAWICLAGGKTYNCPNNTDYDCIVLDPNQPTTKVCAPKTGTSVDAGVPQG